MHSKFLFFSFNMTFRYHLFITVQCYWIVNHELNLQPLKLTQSCNGSFHNGVELTWWTNYRTVAPTDRKAVTQ